MKILEIIFQVFSILGIIILLRYAYDTYRLRKNSEEQLKYQREKDLRPVILRSGYIDNWESLERGIEGDSQILFSIIKNIAKNISGHIIIKHKKYKLYFFNEVSMIQDGTNNAGVIYKITPEWSWMKPETILYASFKMEEYEDTTKDNEIFITYEDIENNKYCTIEDNKFHQESKKKMQI